MKKLVTILAMIMLSSAAFGQVFEIDLDAGVPGQFFPDANLAIDFSPSPHANIAINAAGQVGYVRIKGWMATDPLDKWSPVDLSGTIVSLDVRFNVASLDVGDPLTANMERFDLMMASTADGQIASQEGQVTFYGNPPAGNVGEWITLSWGVEDYDHLSGTWKSHQVMRIDFKPLLHADVWTAGDSVDVANLRFDAIPEPGTMALLAFGLLALLVRRKK